MYSSWWKPYRNNFQFQDEILWSRMYVENSTCYKIQYIYMCTCYGNNIKNSQLLRSNIFRVMIIIWNIQNMWLAGPVETFSSIILHNWPCYRRHFLVYMIEYPRFGTGTCRKDFDASCRNIILWQPDGVLLTCKDPLRKREKLARSAQNKHSTLDITSNWSQASPLDLHVCIRTVG